MSEESVPTDRIEKLMGTPEIRALRNLSLLIMESKNGMSERHHKLLHEAFRPANRGIRDGLKREGYSKEDINAAYNLRASRWE